jgi:hypothetical protein
MRHRHSCSATARAVRAARALPLLLLVAPPALLLAGCRGQKAAEAPPAQAAAAAPRPPMPAGMKAVTNYACELLPEADARELLGGPVKPPVTTMHADIGLVASRCAYLSETGNPIRVVTLLANRWQQAPAARQAFEHAHVLAQSISGQAPVNVPGLGDRAYWAGGTVNQLNVLDGDTWLVVTCTLGADPDLLGAARTAAERVLAHRH